jgi:hypothetical protein
MDKGAPLRVGLSPTVEPASSLDGFATSIPSAGFQTSSAYGLFKAIVAFRAELPGWWFTVGECSVSADASCGPDVAGPDAGLLKRRQFDAGFHADLPQPANMADALADVLAQAIEARRAETSGSARESAVGEADAPTPSPPSPENH